MEYDKTIFQKNMKTLRYRSGLSQTKFAQELGLSQHSISEYEKEDSNPTLDSLLIISRYFNISIETLLTTDMEEDVFNFGMRKPESGDQEFSHFEGMVYHVYYISERSTESFYNGFITFDDEYDKEHLFLHGIVKTGHTYDCKMVIEGTHSLYVYGTEINIPRRFHLVMYYPDFRDEMDYFAGLGIVTRIDSNKYIKGMRVAITKDKLDLDEATIDDKLMYYLTEGNSEGEVHINREIDNEFREWIRRLKVD